eukprot:scaffold57290_cov16-Tisochrysis_lutea.AAC.1
MATIKNSSNNVASIREMLPPFFNSTTAKLFLQLLHSTNAEQGRPPLPLPKSLHLVLEVLEQLAEEDSVEGNPGVDGTGDGDEVEDGEDGSEDEQAAEGEAGGDGGHGAEGGQLLSLDSQCIFGAELHQGLIDVQQLLIHVAKASLGWDGVPQPVPPRLRQYGRYELSKTQTGREEAMRQVLRVCHPQLGQKQFLVIQICWDAILQCQMLQRGHIQPVTPLIYAQKAELLLFPRDPKAAADTAPGVGGHRSCSMKLLPTTSLSQISDETEVNSWGSLCWLLACQAKDTC